MGIRILKRSNTFSRVKSIKVQWVRGDKNDAENDAEGDVEELHRFAASLITQGLKAVLEKHIVIFYFFISAATFFCNVAS